MSAPASCLRAEPAARCACAGLRIHAATTNTKKPPRGWLFRVWWRRRELNPRPKALRARRYMLSPPFNLVLRQHDGQSTPQDQPLGFSSCRKAPASSDPVIMTLHPRARAQVGSGLGLKRPERSRRRSRLDFCHRINEEDDALGMLQATSRPPSKPDRPRGRADSGGAERGNQAVPIASQAARFFARITRCFSRFQSRSFSVSRLSCSCLPRATPRSIFTRLFFQYSASGINV